MRLFTRLLLDRFCSKHKILFFFSFGGIFGKFWFCAFLFVFPLLRISGFFLHFREFLVLVVFCSVLTAGLVMGARRRHLQLARGSVYSG